jgi:hypothetical protein
MIYGVEVDLDKSKCFSLSHSLARTVDEANGTQANDDSATFSLFSISQISIALFPSNFNYLNELSTR